MTCTPRPALLRPVAALAFQLCILISAFGQSETGEQIAPRTTARETTITGRVVASTGEALPFAAVRVQSVGSSIGGARTTNTDGQGRFTIPDLDAGAYLVTANAPGYVLVHDPSASEPESAYRRPGDTVQITMQRGGIVTGKVTNRDGEPVVGIPIRPVRIRDEENRPVRTPEFFAHERRTDDRGLYRLYGLEPGAYVILAGGSAFNYSGQINAFGDLAPTYHPAGTRDTAAEIIVRSGTETNNIDIRYRGEPGRIVSGKLTGAVEGKVEFGGVSVSLTHAATETTEASTFVSGREGNYTFAFGGITDGEYLLTARRGFGDEAGAASTPRRVVVRGADVTNIELALTPLGSLGGTLLVEPLSAATTGEGGACHARENSRVAAEEVVIVAKRQDLKPGERRQQSSAGTPAKDGKFRLRNLDAGRYRLDARLPGDDLYIKSIATTAQTSSPAPARAQAAPRSATNAKPASPTNEFDLGAGTDVGGIRIVASHGAAAIEGRIEAANPNQPTPARLRIYLLPDAPDELGQPWRFREAVVTGEGAWSLRNVAPGKYRLIALPTEMDERNEPRLLTSDAAARIRLLSLAKSNGELMELQACQRLTDYVVRHAPAVALPR